MLWFKRLCTNRHQPGDCLVGGCLAGGCLVGDCLVGGCLIGGCLVGACQEKPLHDMRGPIRLQGRPRLHGVRLAGGWGLPWKAATWAAGPTGHLPGDCLVTCLSGLGRRGWAGVLARGSIQKSTLGTYPFHSFR
ncbi:MAG TPA: hypothetical protein DCP91_03820 [Eggerthellaceae bacterium]|nr:hypothetical protein [Eggerthellaceae bacterium]